MISQPKKLLALVGVTLLLGALVVGIVYQRSRTVRTHVRSSEQLQVVSTIYPWADVAKNIGGDLVQVTTLTPPGQEPHDYEPTPQDLVSLYQADVVILNGNGLDAWADKLIPELRAKAIRVVEVSQNLPTLTTETGEGQDPHVWLDPVLVSQAAEVISGALAVGSSDSVQLITQTQAYQARLKALDDAYRVGLAQCQQRDIVTSHDAFRYLAKRYALTNYYILGLSPEEDPSPQKIAEVADLARQKGMKTIFFETLVSPKLAQTIANEIGVETATLNPIEGLTENELDLGKDYLQVMQDNLVQLRAALRCP